MVPGTRYYVPGIRRSMPILVYINNIAIINIRVFIVLNIMYNVQCTSRISN